MKKLVVLDGETLGREINIDLLKEFGEVVYYDLTNEEDVKDRIKDANIVITNKVVLNDVIIYPKSSFKGNGLFDYITPEEYGIEDTSKIQTDEYEDAMFSKKIEVKKTATLQLPNNIK